MSPFEQVAALAAPRFEIISYFKLNFVSAIKLASGQGCASFAHTGSFLKYDSVSEYITVDRILVDG